MLELTVKDDQRPFFISKDSLDTVNSVSWFAMDASWMLGGLGLSYFFILPTVFSGILLCYIEKRPSVSFINGAILCWIFMNTLWMLSEHLESPLLLTYARISFGLGLLMIFGSILLTRDLKETFSHFRRFRLRP